VDFHIAYTFTGSLARLTGDEQKAVTTPAFDPRLNLASRSLTVHEPDTVCIGVRVINHLGDRAMKVFEVV
jgi:hypothetical protein